jgi:autotransporter-associated beta strand protein
VLSGNNGYSGPTLVSAGILTAAHANALGTTATGTSVSNGAQLALEGSITTAAEPLTITPGTSSVALLRNNSGNNIWNGVITSNTTTSTNVSRIEANAGSTLTLANTINVTGSAHQLVFQGDGTIQVTGRVTGVGALTSSVTGTGLRVLSNASNDYTGNTSVNGGTLQLGVNNAIPSGTGRGNVVLNGGTTAGILDLNGYDLAVNGLTGATGAVLGVVLNNASGTNKTLTVGNNNTTASYFGVIADNSSGTGTVALTKTGTGVQTLAGVNT